MKLLLGLLGLLATFRLSQASTQPANSTICPPPKVYTACGTACPDNCTDGIIKFITGQKPAKNCTLQCVAGCFCPRKLYLNQYGQCLTKEQCYVEAFSKHKKQAMNCNDRLDQCPIHQEYSACGTMCPMRCVDVLKGLTQRTCTEQCVAGCFCQDGYVISSHNTCVPISECFPKKHYCPPGMVYDACGTACPITCVDIRNQPRIKSKPCPAICKQGCFCGKGTYLNHRSQCVTRRECLCRHRHGRQNPIRLPMLVDAATDDQHKSQKQKNKIQAVRKY